MSSVQLALGAILAISIATSASAACYEDEHGLTICPPIDEHFFHEPPEVAAAKRECTDGSRATDDPVCSKEFHRELHELCHNLGKYDLDSADMAPACQGE